MICPKTLQKQDLLDKIKDLNNDEAIDGFIVQLPLPKHIDEQKVIMAIDPDKDVDGFHPVNVGKMTLDLLQVFTGNSFWYIGIIGTLSGRNFRKTCGCDGQ